MVKLPMCGQSLIDVKMLVPKKVPWASNECFILMLLY